MSAIALNAPGKELSPPLSQSLLKAVPVVAAVLQGESLTSSLKRAVDGLSSTSKFDDAEDTFASTTTMTAAVRDLCYNTLRDYGVVDALCANLARGELEPVVRALLYCALSELIRRPATAHAVVDQAVQAAVLLRRARAKGLVNACLREFLRHKDKLLAAIQKSDTGRYHHPQWWVDHLRRSHPVHWQDILAQAEVHPPMSLRVNLRRSNLARSLERLQQAGIAVQQPVQSAEKSVASATAIQLARPVAVTRLPGFAEGELSVQDAGAQLAAVLLDVQPGMRVLDACAAPGGKAAHVLERVGCQLLAMDVDPLRSQRIQENFARLGLQAEIVVGDAADPDSLALSAGRQFDRILADVPCTASGVVRRHPDIRWLRRAQDIASFAAQQQRLLEALWPRLVVGGKLLYVTCSVFPEENSHQMQRFLQVHPDAKDLHCASMPLARAWHMRADGQLLPSAAHDGFFYALLGKCAESEH